MVITQPNLLDRVFHFLSDNPDPEEVLNLSTTKAESARIAELARKDRANTMSYAEEQEMHQYLLAERYVRLAKAKALERLAERE